MSLIITSSTDSPAEVNAVLERAGYAPEPVSNDPDPVEQESASASPAPSEATEPTEGKPADATETPENKSQESEGETNSQGDQPSGEQPANEQPPASETEPGKDSEQAKERPRDEQGRFKPEDVPPGVKKRIDKVVSQREAEKRRAEEAERRAAELEAKLAELQAAGPAAGAKPEEKTEPVSTEQAKPAATEQPAAPPEPDLDQYLASAPEYESYEKTVARWGKDLTAWASDRAIDKLKAELKAEREAATKAAATNDQWAEKIAPAAAKHADWNQVIESASKANLVVTPVMHDALFESEIAGEMMYHLATNPDECNRIAKLPPVKQVAELTRLEIRLMGEVDDEPVAEPAAEPVATEPPAPPTTPKAPEQPKPRPSNAPPPIRPVSAAASGAAPTRPQEGWNLAQYEAWEKTPEGQAWRKGRS